MQKTRVAPNVAGLSIRLMSDGQVKSDYSELPAVATLTEEFAPILHFLTVKDLLVHIFSAQCIEPNLEHRFEQDW